MNPRTDRVRLRGLSHLLSLLALLPFAGVALAQERAPASAQPAPNLAGRWELNAQLSDPAPTEAQASGGGGRQGSGGRGIFGGYGGGTSGAGTGGRAGTMGEYARAPQSAAARSQMEHLFETPRVLTIVERENQVTMTDDLGRTLKLTPDGSKVKEEQVGATLERTTRWDNKTLVTTVKLSNGVKATQTFSKASQGLQLIVFTKLEGGQLPKPIEFRRVYDQALQ